MPHIERGMLPDVHAVHGTDKREGRLPSGNVLIFKGQGFVKPGMGKDLYDHSDKVRALHDATNAALGFNLTDIIFNDPDGNLLETHLAQPATILTNRAQEIVAKEQRQDLNGPLIYVAGNSLGEYSAAIAAGALDYFVGVRFARRRGLHMHEAHLENPGKLGTALYSKDDGKREEQMGIVAEVQKQTGIEVCLDNSELQVVYGGTNAEMDETAGLLSRHKIKFTFLKTIGAFHHSRLMAPARKRLEPELDATEINDAIVPLISNTSAQEIQRGDEIRQEFKDQMTNPVLWRATTDYLLKQGFKEKVELGEKPTFLDMHPLVVGAGITLTAIMAGGITVGWRLTHPRHHKS